MNKRIAKLWVELLRSGEFKQGNGILEDSEGQHCCLGVLCNIALVEGVCTYDKGNSVCYDDRTGLPSDNITEWAELKHKTVDELVNMNDHKGKSFEQIANYIEKNWKKL